MHKACLLAVLGVAGIIIPAILGPAWAQTQTPHAATEAAPARSEPDAPAQGQPPPPGPPAQGPTQPEPAKWSFAVEPYLWLAGVDGTLRYEIPEDGDGGADVGLTLDNLSYAFMIGGEARKGKWSIFTDLILLGIDSHHDTVESVRFPSASGRVAVDADPNSETSTSLDALEWTLAGGYVVTRGGPFSVEVIAGVRHLTVEAESEWRIAGTITGPGPSQAFDREGGASQRVDLWDGIVGVRGQLALGKRWFLPFHADIGAGSSDLTWQAIAGVGYSFGSWDLRLAYRHLHYDMGEDELLQGVSFSGVGIGAKIRF